jgi:protein-disulfide isomerase
MAAQLELDVDEFNRCLEDDAMVKLKISNDLKDGNIAGVRSTPTLVVQRRRLAGVLTVAKWEKVFREIGIELKETSAQHASTEDEPSHEGHAH